MIEEEAYVAEVSDGAVWVEKNRVTGCSGCSEPCASALTSQFFAAKQSRLRVASNIELNPGDKVLLGIDDNSLVGVSLVIYLLPLFGFFCVALVGKYLFGSDLAAALGGLSGLGLSFAGYKYLKLFERQSCQPVILRKLN